MVYLGTDTMCSERCVDTESKVQHRTSRRHGLELALGRYNEYLLGIKVQFNGIQEIHCIGLRVVQYFLDSGEPSVQFVFAVLLGLSAILVLPVCGKALLCYIVHTARANLQFYPLSALAHQRCLQGLVSVGLRMRQPVAQTLGMRSVDISGYGIYAPAVRYLVFRLSVALEDYTCGKDVVYFVQCHLLVLHLVPDAVR